jgi:hypothetical protein
MQKQSKCCCLLAVCLQVQAGVRMLATRLVALVPTVTLAVIFEASHTFDTVAQTLNVVQSLVLPFALIPVIHVAADKKLLGEFASHPALTVVAGMVAGLVSAVNGYVLIDYMRTEFPNTNSGIVAGFSIFIAVYYLLVLYFAVSVCVCHCWCIHRHPAIAHIVRTASLQCPLRYAQGRSGYNIIRLFS